MFVVVFVLVRDEKTRLLVLSRNDTLGTLESLKLRYYKESTIGASTMLRHEVCEETIEYLCHR